MEKTKPLVSSIEKSGQISWSSDELEGSGSGSGSGHVKSYTCAFCKRGFSNAQALGGHMNIHRKDRAKLRQFSEENLLSLDIAKSNPIEEDSEEDTVVILESSEEQQISSPNNNKRKEENKMKQLLLAESSSSSHNIDQYLDLELRLGPVPREPSSSAKNTKDLYRSSSN